MKIETKRELFKKFIRTKTIAGIAKLVAKLEPKLNADGAQALESMKSVNTMGVDPRLGPSTQSVASFLLNTRYFTGEIAKIIKSELQRRCVESVRQDTCNIK